MGMEIKDIYGDGTDAVVEVSASNADDSLQLYVVDADGDAASVALSPREADRIVSALRSAIALVVA